jgi:hypothetical protein
MSKSIDAPVNFPDWIEAIAAMAGLKLEKLGETLVAVRCEMAEGRTQIVWISPLGKDRFHNTIIGISSPALKLGSTGRCLSQQQANDLLRQNAKMPHGAWAIENIEGDDYLVMFDTQIAETMDAQEFAASVKATALLADTMEKRLDKDEF